jgi:excisionase family DNA binding protein
MARAEDEDAMKGPLRKPDPKGAIGEPSPLDRFRMRAAAERAGVPRQPAWTPSHGPSAPRAAKASPAVDASALAADDVLTREQAAEFLKVCTKTVSRLVKREGLPAVLIGREYRLRRSAVLAWMARRESNGAD